MNVETLAAKSASGCAHRPCPVMGFTADGYDRISSTDEPVVVPNNDHISQPTATRH